MGDWPARTDPWGDHVAAISPVSALSCGPGLKGMHNFGTPISTAWPAANRAILVPFRLPKTVVAYQMVAGSGATASGNFDVGIYDAAGNRIVSGGSTAKGNSVETIVNITDTTLGPGLYYMAMSADGTNNYMAITLTNATSPKFFGIRQASTAFVLPATVTFETIAASFVPSFCVLTRSQ